MHETKNVFDSSLDLLNSTNSVGDGIYYNQIRVFKSRYSNNGTPDVQTATKIIDEEGREQ